MNFRNDSVSSAEGGNNQAIMHAVSSPKDIEEKKSQNFLNYQNL